jgi:anti-sigma regulatory factor (Ser/Thr protein kinase)
MEERPITTQPDGGSSVALLERSLDREVEQVTQVRHDLTAVLLAIGQEAVAPDATLVVSELLANAVAYADSTVRVSIYRVGSCLHIEVCDDGAGHPEVVKVDPEAAEGRGLFIVDQLATRWGVDESDPNGKTVWCELTLPPASPPSGRGEPPEQL